MAGDLPTESPTPPDAADVNVYTVADLVRQCDQYGISTEDAILLIERDIPLPVTDADYSVGVAGGQRWVGFVLDTPAHDYQDEDG